MTERAITINPRNFIMTPYLTCPKCGASEFGVLSVGETRCLRRCRACWHTATVYLPELRKKVIYIDQFVISNIMKQLSPEIRGHERVSSEPLWNELFKRLEMSSRLQLIICSDSKEHQHESLMAPFYQSLKTTYEHFSGGVSFYDGESIRRIQIGRIVRCWLEGSPATFDLDPERVSHGRIHEWSGRIFVTVDGTLPGLVEELRRVRALGHGGLREVFQQWQREKKSFADVYENEKRSYTQTALAIYRNDVEKRARAMERAAAGEAPSLNDILPSETTVTLMGVERMFQTNLSPDKATPAIFDFLKSGVMDEAPFNVISSAMYASLAMKAASGQKAMPNQGTFTDINIVSALLPYCDAMFVDNGCRALLRDIPKEHTPSFRCAVFSPNIGEQFLEYLDGIIGSATPEHLKIIKEVYGPEALRTPEGIYGIGKFRRAEE